MKTAAQCLAHFFRVPVNAARRLKKKCAWHEFPRRKKKCAWHEFPKSVPGTIFR
jgi:hypothetical protein